MKPSANLLKATLEPDGASAEAAAARRLQGLIDGLREAVTATERELPELLTRLAEVQRLVAQRIAQDRAAGWPVPISHAIH